MTGITGRMALVVLGLLLALTYLLRAASRQNAELEERRLHAIDALTFNEAALHRRTSSRRVMGCFSTTILWSDRCEAREVTAELRGAGAPGRAS